MWLTEIVSELQRERQMRLFVFPRLKQQGKVTHIEAATRLARLDAAIELINTLRDAGIHQTDQLAIRLTAPSLLNTGKGTEVLLPIIKGDE